MGQSPSPCHSTRSTATCMNLMGVVLSSLITVRVCRGGAALDEIKWPLPLTAGSFDFLLITSITLRWV